MMYPTLRIVGMSVIAGALGGPAPAVVDPFQGAIALIDNGTSIRLDKGTSMRPSGGIPQRDPDDVEFDRLVAMGEEFSKQASTLSPDDAAKQWLGLFDLFAKLPDAYRRRYIAPVSSAGVLNYLPGPATWPTLQKLVEARAAKPPANAKAEAMLLFILHTLNDRESAQWADLTKMTAPGGVFEADLSSVLPLGGALSKIAAQPAGVEAFWSRMLASLSVRKVTLENSASTILDLPDLVTLLGEPKAEVLLTQALTLPGVRVNQVYGEATQALARKVALAHLAQIKLAPWVLTHSMKGDALYEALTAKFPSDTSDDSQGEIYHLMALIVQGKVKEAIPPMAKIEKTLSIDDAIEKTAANGYGEEVSHFIP